MKKATLIILFLLPFLVKSQIYNVRGYGNSIMNGYQATTNFLDVAAGILGANYNFSKFAQNGYQTGQMASNYMTEAQPAYNASYQKNIFVPYEYINSIIHGEGMNTWTLMRGLCLNMRALGWKIAIPTMIADLNDTWTETTRAAINDSIIANSAHFELVVRLDTITNLTYADGLHPDNAGQSKMGAVLASALGTYNSALPVNLPYILRIGRKVIVQ
jgi:hypothetical protein